MGTLFQAAAVLCNLTVFCLASNFIHHHFYDAVRRASWLAHAICPDCGYNLTGNTSGTCPECGADVPSHASPGATAPQKS